MATNTTPAAAASPKETLNRGGDPLMKECPSPVSFRDKVLGEKVVPPREKADLIQNKVVQMEPINGNRLMLMFHVDKKIIEEFSIPWKDALVIKLLGKTLGYNIMKTKLATVWKI